MLKQLRIENLAIISACDIAFGEGMTVLTGETGAGKSIVVDAIGLLLGRQASDDWIKSDADTAIIEAVFQVSKVDLSDELQTFVDDLDIVSVSRKLTRGKPSTCRINGELVPLKLLKHLMSPLIAIIGQHEHMSLMDADTQRNLLDAFGDVSYKRLLHHFSEVFKEHASLKRECEKLKKSTDDQVSRSEFLRFQIEDIAQNHFIKGEEESLLTQKQALKRADKAQHLSKVAVEACDRLCDASLNLNTAIKVFQDHFAESASMYQQVSDLQHYVADVTFDIQKKIKTFQDTIDVNADDLEARLDTIFRYKQKYRVLQLDQLCDLQMSLQEELAQLEGLDHSLKTIEERFQVLDATLEALGLELSTKRLALAQDVQKNVEHALEKLSFSHSDFRIHIEKNSAGWTAFGGDMVSFMVSTNIGEPAKPLHKVASGGELSRIMLAIRTVFSEVDVKETLIFDEVDTGVGGLTANTVGEFLKRVSDKSQVICVTHLPQIAQLADRHLLVEKYSEDKKTQTRLRLLVTGEREKELVRMVGGDAVIDRIVPTQM